MTTTRASARRHTRGIDRLCSWRKWLAVFAVATLTHPLPSHAQGRVEGTIRSRDGAVPDAAVFLVPVGRDATLRIGTDRIDQVDLQFVPRAVVVTPGSTVEFPNSDVVMHNVFHPGPGTRGFDLGTYPQTEARNFTFTDPGIYVMLCHVHPEMVGYVFVVPSMWRAATDRDGAFSIPDVPPGEYRLHVWHRRYADADLPVVVRTDTPTVVSPLVAPAERRRSRP